MPLPELTPEQRAAALAKAARARKARAEVRGRLKSSATTLAEVLERSDDEVLGRMRVTALLEALPGVGAARAEKLMERCGIARSRRLRGLGAHQKAALLEAVAARGAGSSR